MLVSLHLKNIALIDEAEIEFCSGINILSGETGAGKSVILDALNFVLGAKADRTMIRHGEDFCLASCTFSNYSPLINKVLEEFDIEASNELIIKRKFDLSGNGYIKLNGENVTATMLRKVTSLLVDVHGQSEHFLLLSKAKQLECIDSGAKLDSELDSLSKILAELNSKIKEFESLGGNPDERARRLDLLDYQINEIEKADLKEGEKEELLQNKILALNFEKLTTNLQAVYSAISNEGGAIDSLLTVQHNLKSICDLGDNYNQLLDRTLSVCDELEEISSTVDDILSNFDFDGLNIDEIEQRLEVYSNFARKYGTSYENIINYLEKAKLEKDSLINFEKNSAELFKEIQTLKAKAYSKCEKLSVLRKKFATDFAKRVTLKLAELGMPNAKFLVQFEDLPAIEEISSFSASGLDKIEFMFSANAGEPLKPLSKIISGGEMSRFMLALKTQLSVISSCYVFDEIDAGISGVAASIVAKQFAQIATEKQIIAISHLPQITAMSDRSILIAKEEVKDKTHTNLKVLTADEKVTEINRLIGAVANDEIASLHARKMIEEADNYKNSLKR
ncbi:MAG: DNA repair protein RecN [Clostridiales bacterium]|nr:DNA repair protein RecN [Clostridiales bacterium]